MSQKTGSVKRVGRGVIGVLSRRGHYLMIRRAAGLRKAGYWCFPGGHLEPGENSRDAIRRELAEELGVDVEPIKRLGSVRLLGPRYILAVWRVAHCGEDFNPAPAEIAEVRWVPADQVSTIQPGLESNARVAELLAR
ncbi:MAG: NUDIX hydrolase [Phycisphaerales bacterium]|nr:MAG: NUDIX hydrolase [Phycisphaerales bacterium]